MTEAQLTVLLNTTSHRDHTPEGIEYLNRRIAQEEALLAESSNGMRPDVGLHWELLSKLKTRLALAEDFRKTLMRM